MNDDLINAILGENERTVPLRDFTSRVMGRVRREAHEPPPIAFPWKRAFPGMVAAFMAISASVIFLVVGFARSGSLNLAVMKLRAASPSCGSALPEAMFLALVVILATFTLAGYSMQFTRKTSS